MTPKLAITRAGLFLRPEPNPQLEINHARLGRTLAYRIIEISKAAYIELRFRPDVQTWLIESWEANTQTKAQ